MGHFLGKVSGKKRSPKDILVVGPFSTGRLRFLHLPPLKTSHSSASSAESTSRTLPWGFIKSSIKDVKKKKKSPTKLLIQPPASLNLKGVYSSWGRACLENWASHENMRHSWLRSVMRGKKRNGAFTPPGLPVPITCTSTSLSPTRSRSHWIFLTGGKHIFCRWSDEQRSAPTRGRVKSSTSRWRERGFNAPFPKAFGVKTEFRSVYICVFLESEKWCFFNNMHYT